MDLITSMFRFFLVFWIVRVILNTILTLRFRKRQTEETIDPIKKFPEEDQKEVAVEMVFDQICQIYVPKTKAYQIVEGDIIHYFCSWECRQNCIEHMKS
ncbi:hypothetical protein SAMN05660472_01744 [Natronincola ferrireducens]|uniref:MYM-type domain-containing protein n=2 Tax=Natronincola ferrireducens TaxID=393762 RepID=A0A1G9DUY0_9FIRM|nr:hypothetical protein SAMN05660472_01744 [Natronincola ferrireducens]